jgi:hypothetical protein
MHGFGNVKRLTVDFGEGPDRFAQADKPEGMLSRKDHELREAMGAATGGDTRLRGKEGASSRDDDDADLVPGSDAYIARRNRQSAEDVKRYPKGTRHGIR